MNIKTYLQNEKTKLEQQIANHEKFIEESPKGRLIVRRVGNYFAWEIQDAALKEKDIESKSNTSSDKSKDDKNIKDGGNPQYIKKENESLAQKLAAKGYVEAQLKDERADLKAINAYLKSCSCDKNRNRYLAKNQEYQRLLEPYIAKYDINVEAWFRDKYTGPVPHPENLKILTEAGFYVRSKSEERIVSLLIKHGIPYKYEEHLISNGHDIFPDFTIMNRRTHQIYIWEHLGMMDNYNYRIHTFDKIQDYAPIGYYAGENLIFTYETNKSGFDVVWAEAIIEHFFK